MPFEQEPGPFVVGLGNGIKAPAGVVTGEGTRPDGDGQAAASQLIQAVKAA
jgi:hypothetical protein